MKFNLNKDIMTTIAKPKRRNRRMATPLNERLFPTMREHLWSPWHLRTFPRHISNMAKVKDADSIFDDDFFEDHSQIPAMNIKEHKQNFEIEVAVPGFTKEDFEVSIEGNILNISGEASNKEEETEEDYTRQEFNYRSFERSLTLPETIDLGQDIKASYENGILKLNLFKKELTKEIPKKVIDIN
jgi:HSP20 family protein